MKKTLLALAVLGTFAGAASAQSSVTIYGVVDLGIQRTNGGTATNGGVVQGAAGRAYQMRASTPSRVGLRGNEDLGGGLSAQFQIEHRFEADTGQLSGGGAINSTFWQGRSYVQLTSAKLGSVYLGRDYTPSFWVHNKSDPFGEVGVGQALSGLMAGYSALDPASTAAASTTAGTTRTSNTLGYKSPNFGGLTVQVAGAASESSSPAIGRQVGANVEYSKGPIWAAAGYDLRTRQRPGSAPAVIGGLNGASPVYAIGTSNSIANVGAAYDLGFVRPVAYYARTKTGPTGNFRNNVWMVGATAPLVGGKLKAMYFRLNLSDAAGALNANANDQRKFAVGYDYPLSRRTNLYADFSFAKEQGPRTNNRAAGFGVVQ